MRPQMRLCGCCSAHLPFSEGQRLGVQRLRCFGRRLLFAIHLKAQKCTGTGAAAHLDLAVALQGVDRPAANIPIHSALSSFSSRILSRMTMNRKLSLSKTDALSQRA